MNIKFDPKNVVMKLCMTGMNLEDSGNIEDATTMFNKAWHETTDDYEKFVAAYHLARQRMSPTVPSVASRPSIAIPGQA